MRILSVGSMTGISNTCRFRNMCLEMIAEHIDIVNTSGNYSIWYRLAYRLFQYHIPVPLPDHVGANNKILDLVSQNEYDVVWIDKGLIIKPSTLKKIKERLPSSIIVSFSPDNMMKRLWQSKQFCDCIALYDVHITTKSFIIEDFYAHGAKKVILANKTFQKDFHYPRNITKEEKKRLGADVGFVGTWEKERCDSILYLARHGVKVKVFGDKNWEKYSNICGNLEIVAGGLYNDDYAKAFGAFKISLCFLKKCACDQITARSVEIPACGGFMLAERTNEHLQMFEEGKEAVFFSSDKELLEKCVYYLCHDEEREKICNAGRKRCLESDYSNDGMIRRVMTQIYEDENRRSNY